MAAISEAAGSASFEERETLREQFGPKERKASDVPSRLREAGDETVTDRIPHYWHHNWNGARGLLRCARGERIRRNDQIRVQTYQLLRESGKAFDLALGMPEFDNCVGSLHIAKFCKALLEGVERP